MAARHREESELLTERVVSPPPPLYKVLLLNDDFTPMDFVIQVLERFFTMSREQATLVMLKVHNEGLGLAGILSPRCRGNQGISGYGYAREHQHPLQCVMEENK
jgi:ATP-dependent Clp protease adaptor protein ClpS